MNSNDSPRLAVIVIVRASSLQALPKFLSAFGAWILQCPALEVHWVFDSGPNHAADDAPADARDQVDRWLRKHGRPARTVAPGAATLSAAIEATTAPWLAFLDRIRPDTLPVPIDTAGLMAPQPYAVAKQASRPVQRVVPELEQLAPLHACWLHRACLAAPLLHPDERLRPDLAAEVLVWRTLLMQPGQVIVDHRIAARPHPEPGTAVWRDPATYASVLQHAFAETLAMSRQRLGHVPAWLQQAVLQHLHWYFTVDERPRAPTVLVSQSDAAAFHERVDAIMQFIEPSALHKLDAPAASTQVRHALFSYLTPVLHSQVVADAYDHDRELVRLTWWIHGAPPSEQVLVDGTRAAATYGKLRACSYYYRRLLRQRIVWIPAKNAKSIQVFLNGTAVPIVVGKAAFVTTGHDDTPQPTNIKAVQLAYPPGKGGQEPLAPGWRGWKVRLVKALARLPLVRSHFADAWVFIDREEEADDSAEHLYRWVRQHHPDVNAWFVLRRDSPDWQRLRKDGFRLVTPGFRRRLLMLNSRHIISTHTDYAFGKFDPSHYGDAMRWRSTFLQHGVTTNDVVHWLGPLDFDCFVTSSPAEHASLIDDDTPYPYTAREVRLTGMPRHDRLFQFALQTPADRINLLLVMPTWRANLVDERAVGATHAERLAAFHASEYAQRWRALLSNASLRARIDSLGLELAFMPHPNARPFLDAFELPVTVKLVTAPNELVQQAFARTAVFITDYSSVAFEMAFLRRPVFYYQFDRESFYGGDHNWRPGYFDYERCGFGPVANSEPALLQNLNHFFDAGSHTSIEYIERMIKAMPLHDDQACFRVFQAINRNSEN